MEGIVATKRRLRAEGRRRRAALSPGERARASRIAAAYLLTLPEVTDARSLALYAPTGDEADPLLAMQELRERGVTVLFPRVLADGLELVAVTDLARLVVGYRGILEPVGEPTDLESLDAVVVPGLAFDRAGARLGRGGGHYDRLLSMLPTNTARIGFCFACQVVTEVPHDVHDRGVDVVVTEGGVVRTGPSVG
ncbi:MAG TPA: 5-formyltetrahydrofolate cyclo-ligase [Nitriliruptorales bacterium]|nr:5-formyltetrahydrofolate cyclo-ligase [Nitriliruptorales bacterium]